MDAHAPLSAALFAGSFGGSPGPKLWSWPVTARHLLQLGLGCGLVVLAWAGPSGAATRAEGVVPGVYGRVSDWGEQAPPVLNEQPVLVRKTTGQAGEPIYLNVPAAERRHWAQHCVRHRACATPVYFVDAQRWARLQALRGGQAAPAAELASPTAAE